MFQSTHPQRVRHLNSYKDILKLLFQSTHPQRVRPDIRPKDVLQLDVSIHAPTKGATGHFATEYIIRNSFNPRTHKGCDSVLIPKPKNFLVSIHAPTKGATVSKSSCLQRQRVSIHAPTKGATRSQFRVLCFLVVSIHAPTKGATPFFLIILR